MVYLKKKFHEGNYHITSLKSATASLTICIRINRPIKNHRTSGFHGSAQHRIFFFKRTVVLNCYHVT